MDTAPALLLARAHPDERAEAAALSAGHGQPVLDLAPETHELAGLLVLGSHGRVAQCVADLAHGARTAVGDVAAAHEVLEAAEGAAPLVRACRLRHGYYRSASSYRAQSWRNDNCNDDVDITAPLGPVAGSSDYL
jgi:hypothetical protein